MSSDIKYMDVFRDPLWLLHNFQSKYKHIRLPTNAAWNTSNVNGGVTQLPSHLYVNTSITASSRGLGYCLMYGLNRGSIDYPYIDWTKRLELSFIFTRFSSDTEVIVRVQLKEANTEGILTASGIGLQISNYTVVGEAYGTARQTTGTLKILTHSRSVRVKIVLTSMSVEFWIDGVKQAELTGTAVPAVTGAAGYLVTSIVNGVTGGVDAKLNVGNIEVVQAW